MGGSWSKMGRAKQPFASAQGCRALLCVIKTEIRQCQNDLCPHRFHVAGSSGIMCYLHYLKWGQKAQHLVNLLLFWVFLAMLFPRKSPLPDAVHMYFQPGRSFCPDLYSSSEGFARARYAPQPARLYRPHFASSRASRGTALTHRAGHGARKDVHANTSLLPASRRKSPLLHFFSSPPRAFPCRAVVLLPHKVTDSAFALVAARFRDSFTGTPTSRRAELYPLFLQEVPASTSAALQD